MSTWLNVFEKIMRQDCLVAINLKFPLPATMMLPLYGTSALLKLREKKW